MIERQGNNMKKLEIIIKPEKLEDLKKILNECKANGLMITNIMGYGNQKGYVNIYRGTEYHVNLLPKVKVETVVMPETAEKIVDRVVKEINTGNVGDGKIFIYEVEDAISPALLGGTQLHHHLVVGCH
jgi:nitrogen regulatory protein P-II 1